MKWIGRVFVFTATLISGTFAASLLITNHSSLADVLFERGPQNATRNVFDPSRMQRHISKSIGAGLRYCDFRRH